MIKEPEHIYSGVYQHFKGGLYFVLGLARHTETNERLICYIPLYTKEGHEGPRLQVRPLGKFFENVEHEGKTVPRFKYLGKELEKVIQ